MVKERDEQMIEAEEKEREEKERRRRESWAKFKSRAATLFAWAVMLVALGGIGTAIYFLAKSLTKTPQNVWIGLLAAVLAIAAVVGLVRVGKTAGVAALFLIGSGIGGYGYFNGWFCQWGFGSNCPTISVDIPTALTDDGVDLGSITYAEPFTESCEAQREGLAAKEEPANCVDIFFGTNRVASGDSFSDDIGEAITYGSGSVLVPFIFPDVEIERFCEQIDLFWGLSFSVNFFCPKGDLQHYTTNDFEVISEKEYLLRRKALRQKGERSEWIGLARLEENESDTPDTGENKFFEEIQSALDPDYMGVLVYVHGFNVDFNAAMESAAHIAADLNFRQNPDPSLPRRNDVGVPILFSWPTLEFGDSLADGLLDYAESQIRAEISARKFGEFVRSIASNTDVKHLNIIAHSMGNRLLTRQWEDMYGNLANRNGEPIAVRIVHASADVGGDEFKRQVATIEGYPSNDGSSSGVYFSATDVALWASTYAQIHKSVFSSFYLYPEADFTRRIEFLETELHRHGWPDWLVSSLVDSYRKKYPTLERLNRLLEDYGISAESIASEDPCRVGGGYGADCLPNSLGNPYFKTYDATLFAPKVGTFEYDWHGFYETSPAIISDIACELRGVAIASGKRALRPVSRVDEESGKAFDYWVFDANATDSNECITSERKYVVRRLKAAEEVYAGFTEVVYFELMKSNLSAEAYAKISTVASRALSENYTSITVFGHADTSGSEKYNHNLSSNRANAVKAALAAEGVPSTKVRTVAVGETEPQVVTADGTREERNRRAVIVVE